MYTVSFFGVVILIFYVIQVGIGLSMIYDDTIKTKKGAKHYFIPWPYHLYIVFRNTTSRIIKNYKKLP